MKVFGSFLPCLALSALLVAGCGDDDEPDPDGRVPDSSVTVDSSVDGGGGRQTVEVDQDITASTTWTASNIYHIVNRKTLFVKNGATLTIEPGTEVQGGNGAVLVITRGSKIMAAGTAAKPILLTTDQPAGQKTQGYWGGLLVLGNAPVNNNRGATPPSDEATFEAFTAAQPEGKFGGTDPNDNSGVIKYVRIEFAGFNFIADREFNNLTLCGVGAATTVDFVQVHRGSDDGIELFGGTVNVKHILSTQNGDDGFDTDNGWQGKAQFVVVQNVAPQGSAEASNGYESDNHASAFTQTPRTLPTVYNATLVGLKSYTGGSSFAMILRRGTGGAYFNHIVTQFPLGIEARDIPSTRDQLENGMLSFKYSIFYNNALDNSNFQPPQATNDINEATYFGPSATNMNRAVDPGLTAAAFSLTAPDFRPSAGAAALTGAMPPPSDGFFDSTATYVGAFNATTDWTAGWSAYPQPKP